MLYDFQTFKIGIGIGEDRKGDAIEACEQRELLRAADRYLAGRFGGFSRTDTVGGWVNPDNARTVYERGVTYTLLIPSDYAENLDGVVEQVAVDLGRLFYQHSVVIHSGGHATIHRVPYPD